MTRWDVIVIGLGGVGSSAVFHLARAGHRVLGIDQYPPAHDRGSSHGRTRIIRQAYFEHPAYVPLLRRSYQLWSELEDLAGEQLFYRTGLVELGPHDGIVIPGVLRSAAEHNLEIEQLSMSQLTRCWPGIGGEEDWHVVIERNAGFLRVEECVTAHLQAAHRLGASCLHGVAVDRWEVDGSGITVTTDQGTERAQSLVLAAGPWSENLLGCLGIRLQILRKHQYWFATREAGYELDTGFPCFFHETANGFFYGFPATDDSGVKVARHSGGQPVDQPVATDLADQVDRDLVDRYVAKYLPGVSNNLLAHKPCFYTQTADEHFVVDLHPRYPQVAIVAGLSGHGFKFTSVLGEIAAQLATNRVTPLDVTLFQIQRRVTDD